MCGHRPAAITVMNRMSDSVTSQAQARRRDTGNSGLNVTSLCQCQWAGPGLPGLPGLPAQPRRIIINLEFEDRDRDDA
jgi:hypothetical protein